MTLTKLPDDRILKLPSGKIATDLGACCVCNCKDFWGSTPLRATLRMRCPAFGDPCEGDTKDVLLHWDDTLKYWKGRVTGWACAIPTDFDVEVVCTTGTPVLPPPEGVPGCDRNFVPFARVHGSEWHSADYGETNEDCTTYYARWEGDDDFTTVLGCTISPGGVDMLEIWYP